MKKEGVKDMTGVLSSKMQTEANKPEQSRDYNTWIKDQQESRNKGWKMNVEFNQTDDTPAPPHDEFICPYTKNPHVQLFSSEIVEDYALKNTSIQSKNVQNAARITDEEKMFAPCMVGSLESQFLKMQAMMLGAKRVLDVGTFTGMSALAFAEGCLMGNGMKNLIAEKYQDKLFSNFKVSLQDSGMLKGTKQDTSLIDEVLKQNAPVVTLECYQETADVAQKIFDACEEQVTVKLPHYHLKMDVGKAIDLRVGQAADEMRTLSDQIDQGLLPPFDIIFLDADKESYATYYDLAMEGYGEMNSDDGRITKMLSTNGVILADNSLCALLYDKTDFRSQTLHDFNQKLKNDERVDQVILTIREGITMIKPKSLTNYMGHYKKFGSESSGSESGYLATPPNHRSMEMINDEVTA